MGTKPKTQPMPDSYFKLVRRFPLVHIRDDAHLDAAHQLARASVHLAQLLDSLKWQ